MRRALALGLSLLFALGCIGVAQQLSGSWDLEIQIDPQQTSFADSLGLSSTLKVNYTIGDWTFGSSTVLDENGWVDQDFSTTGILGPYTLTAAVDFNPDATFGSLVMTTSTTFAGVLLGTRFTLEGNDTFFTFTASGYAGDVDISISVDFGDDDGACDFPFEDVTIGVDFPFCCADISSTLSIDCAGFDQIAFSTTGIAIPYLPWLSLGAELVYTLQTKTLTLSPVFNFNSVTCIDFYIQVDSSDNLTIGDISINGIRLTCDVGAVTFTGISYWGTGSKPGRLAGTEYWEVYTVETNGDACCGPLSFDVSVFFLENGLRLFDVSLFEVNLELTVAPQFTFSTGLKIDVEVNATTIWTLGFQIDW
ncbi:hypothetical protein KKG90_08715 [Candidatus Bipolaricaulota bacterium]|nr:hypothetical protein [Candidatus Bipolaricaulota bacterium]